MPGVGQVAVPAWVTDVPKGHNSQPAAEMPPKCHQAPGSDSLKSRGGSNPSLTPSAVSPSHLHPGALPTPPTAPTQPRRSTELPIASALNVNERRFRFVVETN